MSFGNFLENALLDHAFGGPDYTRLATVYILLSSSVIAEDGTGATEPSTGAYARKAVTNDATNFPASVAGAKSNGVAIEFVESTAAWLAGANLTNFAIVSSASGAFNLLGKGTLAVAQAVAGAGVVIRFKIGDLDITLD